MTTDEMLEMESRFAAWPVEQQLRFIERLARRIRRDSFTDHAGLAAQMDEMVNDPGMQRVLNNQDLERTGA